MNKFSLQIFEGLRQGALEGAKENKKIFLSSGEFTTEEAKQFAILIGMSMLSVLKEEEAKDQ